MHQTSNLTLYCTFQLTINATKMIRVFKNWSLVVPELVPGTVSSPVLCSDEVVCGRMPASM